MFKKILIANRGEIAVRIMATCREMGVRTVAVYSEADRSARHVREADEAYFIGPSLAAQSYLQIENIIAVTRQSGAEALHPGYGFLAENADFAAACERDGIIFIGPPASTIRLMSSKILARQLAQTAGAPIVPGYDGTAQDDAILMSEAQRIGFPLLIKASAGGGGKGMRIVHSSASFLEHLASARREAQAAFGDQTVFLERLIAQPRHIEIQVLGDSYGHLIHLGERECSIQRRHQKIIEESPSTALTPALRAEIAAVAVRIAKAAGYLNAGTVEFLLTEDKCFYFLEMNTRLQVEHPVTELVTGFDLVRHQLNIAAGEPLSITQEQVVQRGHAIEVRIYAEDPQQNFLPSAGKISRYIKPAGPGIRVDSGIADGDEITPFYDPMLAKLIVSGEDRPAALARLQRALKECVLLGIPTNIPLLQTISKHPAFQKGHTSTYFLHEYQLLMPLPVQELPQEVLIAAALYEIAGEHETGPSTEQHNPWQTLGPWRMIGEARTISYYYQQREYRVALTPAVDAIGRWQIQTDREISSGIEYTITDKASLVLRQGTRQKQFYVQQQRGEIQIVLAGQIYRLQRRLPPDVATTAHGDRAIHTQKALTAPMAGTIVKIQVHEGESVQAHQTLAILSAMKMEHALTAPYEGQVQRIHCQEGAVVPGGAVIVEMA
jgi:3-methylcrotonyl-CoA carboxylase alpha subunit